MRRERTTFLEIYKSIKEKLSKFDIDQILKRLVNLENEMKSKAEKSEITRLDEQKADKS